MTRQIDPESNPQIDRQIDIDPLDLAAPAAAAAALLARIRQPDPPPFAVLHRPHQHAGAAEILTGDVITVGTLADLPEPGPERPVLAVVPFGQIRERGFEAVIGAGLEVGLEVGPDDAPLLALRVRERALVPLADLIAPGGLPDGPLSFTETGYDVPDEDYERTVRRVLSQEIAVGAGSNFVVHRCLTGRIDLARETPAQAALATLKRLLTGENNAYWTFAVHTGEHTFVGATPERHVSLDAGVARMNPISGTLRHPAGGYCGDAEREAAELAFLADAKERDELAMVLDEELKMMAVLGDRGGRVRGPYLKRMTHLTHTEYVLEGTTSFGPRQVLSATMFAPTVIGSPIRNACRVIAAHERRDRRYYGGVLALIGRDDAGRDCLDAPILIRTAEITADGVVRVAAGATLVRGSQPASELAETRAKARGILHALHPDADRACVLQPSPECSAEHSGQRAVEPRPKRSAEHSGQHGPGGRVERVLAERNRTLARFWLQEQEQEQEPAGPPAPTGSLVTVIDAEDDFTGMLAHLLRSLERDVDVRPWTDLLTDPSLEQRATLVVLGPGPGDPRDTCDRRIQALHGLARTRLANGTPVLGICLGHQVIAHTLGLRVRRLAEPDQGRQREIDLFGQLHRVGFYNSFVADATPMPLTPPLPLPLPLPTTPSTSGFRFSLDADGRRVHALRGPGVTGVQFHPESVLTTDGRDILATELTRLGA